MKEWTMTSTSSCRLPPSALALRALAECISRKYMHVLSWYVPYFQAASFSAVVEELCLATSLEDLKRLVVTLQLNGSAVDVRVELVAGVDYRQHIVSSWAYPVSALVRVRENATGCPS